MSRIRFQNPIIHTPSFKRWMINRDALVRRLRELGIEPLVQGYAFFEWYYFTTLEDWGKVLLDLVLNSNLYSPTFKCADYAFEAQTECAKRYGLNGLRFCVETRSLMEGHAYTIFPHGNSSGLESFKLFEPNDGYQWSGILEVGDFDYNPEKVLM